MIDKKTGKYIKRAIIGDHEGIIEGQNAKRNNKQR
jgi:hypothetical protein